MMKYFFVPRLDDLIHKLARDADRIHIRQCREIDLFVSSLTFTDREVPVVELELFSSIDRYTESESEI